MMSGQVVKAAIQRLRQSRSQRDLEEGTEASSRQPPAPEGWPPPTAAAELIIVPVALEARVLPPGSAGTAT